jgi:hypothetical protein
MSIAALRPAPDLLHRVVRLQMLTIVWMSIEAAVALVAARRDARVLSQIRLRPD